MKDYSKLQKDDLYVRHLPSDGVATLDFEDYGEIVFLETYKSERLNHSVIDIHLQFVD